ncbi:Transglutaminase-like protein [Cordyceps fumosorosea ARSEF 2679]|uniref:Transglutaminase-like protein n=1 Tax=Cordyceps fumosorosea (strain ARSEF 2679) TaxID=1081104 RepID=A0A167V8U5_CORFA|nr:Transglutaminase-like protein [Cordyceps fumosorosea ARSEF 2679]OAA62353.1 Transglutaminase-like protein [Cordyceps fumosorosea ARSEF 2679]
MADTEEPQYTTLSERIAALNKNKTFAANGPPSAKPARRAPPPPPPGRAQTGAEGSKPVTPTVPVRPTKSNPPPLPRRDTQTSITSQDAARPPLPSRTSSTQQPPALPQRQPSTQPNGLLDVRRDSTSSEVSQNSTKSSKSAGQSSWSTTSQNSATAAPRKLPPIQPQETQKPVSTPSLPPRLPIRGNKQDATPARPRIMGFGSSQAPKATTNGQDADGPPPIPTATRPSALQIKEVSSRATQPQPAPELNNCFACRDWSAPDAVAAQYPRQSVPRNDPVGYLAHNLCSAFPSYSDKARAIFTWCHHNIAYDTGAFFGNSVKHQTGESTIFSGLAVCAGYAETYKAIANRAGLECDVVGGHGKGFGYTPLKDGEPVPRADPSGHAWNAVRIDGGGWKLLDACWGAGNVDGATQSFNKVFAPIHFNATNEQFGARHFPEKSKFQYREDGRTVSWEEYYRGRANGEPVTIFSNTAEEGIDNSSMEPANKHIQVNSGQIIRFQFCKICPHWKSEKNGPGKPPLFVLNIHGLDGRKDDMVPIETDGYWHWLDVNSRDLGAPGQKVEVMQITSVDHKDARGLSARDFLAAKGRKAMAFSFLTQWILE